MLSSSFMNDYRHLIPTIIESVYVFESSLWKVIEKGRRGWTLRSTTSLSWIVKGECQLQATLGLEEELKSKCMWDKQKHMWIWFMVDKIMCYKFK